jgi:hypothetical protein
MHQLLMSFPPTLLLNILSQSGLTYIRALIHLLAERNLQFGLGVQKKKKMVLGDDVGLKDSVNLALCTLVGKTSYCSLCKTDIDVWVQSTWLPLLDYSPKISYLTHGWLGFQLSSPEDSSLLLNGHWLFDGGSLMLKRWRISFNPTQDYFRLCHLWVLLPGLALYLGTVQL